MGAAFLITLREGVEISLIVAILFAYLARSGRRELFPAVWTGIAGAAALCIVAALAFQQTVGGFTGKAEQLTEAIVTGAAAAMLTFMIFWMRKHARGMRGELQSKLDIAVEHSAYAVALFAGISVMREGIETALLLLGATSGANAGSGFLFGALAGIFVAGWIGYAFYTSSSRIDLRKFFSITAVLLIFFAAGMVGKSVHELAEFVGLSGTLVNPVWNVTNPLLANSWMADFMAGMFGWSPHPELIRVLAYLAFFIPVTMLFFDLQLRLPKAWAARSARSEA